MKFKKLSLEQKNRYYGLYFILPWFAGFCFLFLTPLFSSLRFSLSNLQVNDEGFTLKYIGLANYREALFSHESYVRTLTESVLDIVLNTPLILIFSLFLRCCSIRSSMAGCWPEQSSSCRLSWPRGLSRALRTAI